MSDNAGYAVTNNAVDESGAASNTGSVPEPDSIETTLAVIPEQIVFAVTKNTAKPDAEPGFGVYKQGNALWKRSNPDEKGGTEHIDTEIAFTVSVDMPVAQSMAGLSQIVTDEDELVNLANSGIYNKIISQLRAKYIQRSPDGDFLYADDNTVTQEAACEIASALLKRRSVSESTKAYKMLTGLSEKDRLDVFRLMGISV